MGRYLYVPFFDMKTCTILSSYCRNNTHKCLCGDFNHLFAVKSPHNLIRFFHQQSANVLKQLASIVQCQLSSPDIMHQPYHIQSTTHTVTQHTRSKTEWLKRKLYTVLTNHTHNPQPSISPSNTHTLTSSSCSRHTGHSFWPQRTRSLA